MTITPETAAIARDRYLNEAREHRRAAARALRALERLEADCARVGIRLIREPRQTHEGESDAGANPHTR